MTQATTIESSARGASEVVIYLQHLLLERIRHNPRYSLRAFAKALEMDPSMLSKIFRGQRRMSGKQFQKIADRLSLSNEQYQSFGRDLGYRVSAASSDTYTKVKFEDFDLISDWYHYAIWECLRMKQFSGKATDIARRLGITASECNLSLQRLERLQLVSQDKRTKIWSRTKKNISNGSDTYSSASMRNFQKQVLGLALEAMDKYPVEIRDQSSMTMAIDSRLIPEAKKRLTRFRRELSDFLQQSGNFDSVYQLSLSLFPLAEAEKRNEK